MPRNAVHAKSLIRRSEDLRDPFSRYVDMSLVLEIMDGPHAGEKTNPWGGIWDQWANDCDGEYLSYWDPDVGWTGEVPKNTKTIQVAWQQLPFVSDFHHSTSMALGGRRSGKTAALGIKCTIMAIYFAGLRGCVVSPTYRQSRNVWRAILRAVDRRRWLKRGTVGVNRTDRILRFVNGAEIVFLSADRDDSSRSEGCAWVVLDERQDISDEAFSNAFLSASEGGSFYKISETATIKPELRDHYDKLMADQERCAIYRMRSRGNPFISHQLFDDAEKMLDKNQVSRELEAEWPEIAGRIYYPWKNDFVKTFPVDGMNDITTSFIHEKFDMPQAGSSAARYFISIDPPLHAVVWRIYSDGTLHAIDELVIGGDDVSGDIRTLSEMCHQRFSPAAIVYDPHETRYHTDIRRYFRRWGVFRLVPMRRVSIEYRITSVRARMEAGKLFVDPRCRFLIEAFNEHRYLDGKPEKRQKSRINDRFTLDHIADAAGYGIYKLFPARYDYEKNEKLAA